LGSRDQGEQNVAPFRAARCLAVFMESLFRAVQLLVSTLLAVFRAIACLFRAVSYVASWTKLHHKQAVTENLPQEPTNTQRSSLYRVERFMWTNSRCV
jgi:hypothetical protein